MNKNFNDLLWPIKQLDTYLSFTTSLGPVLIVSTKDNKVSWLQLTVTQLVFKQIKEKVK